jgi:hypothetical protein
MKAKILALTLALSATLLVGCSDNQGYNGQTATTDWNHQALQKHYTSLADCIKEFSVADCKPANSSVTVNNYNGYSGPWIGPYYFMWGAILHSNGMTTYGNSVPRYGYSYIPSTVIMNHVDYGRVPTSYYRPVSTYSGSSNGTRTSTGTVRGGFGGTSRGFSGGESFGG